VILNLNLARLEKKEKIALPQPHCDTDHFSTTKFAPSSYYGYANGRESTLTCPSRAAIASSNSSCVAIVTKSNPR
jgi:hypothetical protein